MSATSRELLWPPSLFLDLQVPHPQPMQPYNDNQAAMHIAPVPLFPERREPHGSRMSFCSGANTVLDNIGQLRDFENLISCPVLYAYEISKCKYLEKSFEW